MKDALTLDDLTVGQDFKFHNDPAKHPYRLLFKSRGGHYQVTSLLTQLPSIIKENQQVFKIDYSKTGT